MYLPNEILNIIFSYREKHPLSHLIKNVILNYNVDSNPYEITHKYCNSFSFTYWYFFIMRRRYSKLKLHSPKFFLCRM